jgi:hypothetical protein
VQLGELADPRVTWRGMQVCHVGVGGEGTGQRVLAAARAK